MVGSPIAIEGGIAQVWAEAFLRSMERGNGEYGPLTASVTQFDDNVPIEIPAIRSRLDNELRAHGLTGGSETIANTIFPTSDIDVEPRPAGRCRAALRSLRPCVASYSSSSGKSSWDLFPPSYCLCPQGSTRRPR